jgi:membrane protein YdbS with pleckstrin-like domain
MDLPVQMQSGEEVMQVLKRHPASLWGRLALVALVAIIALIIWLTLGQGEGILGTILTIAFVVVLIGAALAAFMVWYRYNNDLWVITNQRLIDYTRSTPFRQEITTAALTNVQDISIRKRGVFNTALDFGDVICQTASASGKTFAFWGVAKPEGVLDMIDGARSKAKGGA